MKTEEKTAMPAGFPRVFFNRIKRGTAGHPVEETVCFSYDSHTGENGKTVKENVRRIGVIRGSSGLGEIEFNDRFLRASPQYEKFIARRTATGKGGRMDIEFFIRKNTAKAPETVPAEQGPATVKTGYTHFIQQFFERSLSGRALRKVCGGKNRLYRRILTMPEFVTLNGTGRLGDAGLWVKDHLVPDRESSFDRDCVHRVLSGLGSDFVLRFYRTKADIRTNDSLKKAGIGEECISLALDGTSYDSWSQSLMAGHGKNRSGSDAKIMSLMVLMDRGTGQVFYHQTPAGNIPDIATPESAARHRGYLGNGMLMLVADRGYWSCCNVNACLANGTLFLIHVKLHSVLMRRIITGLGPGLKYGEGCVKIEKNGETNYGIMTEKDWMWLDPEDNQHKTAKIYCYVFFNPELYTSAISRLLDRVTEINALLAGYRKECAEAARKHKKMPPRPELTAEQKKLIDDEIIVPDPGTASYRINYVKHDPKLIVEGCRMLASNRRLSVEQAFSDYRKRNAIESLFRDLRNGTGLDTVGAQKRVTYEARQFIGVLASELHTEIRACADRYNLKQPVSERLSLKRNSVHATLMELENLEATWDGKTLIPTSNLSKKQAKLYEACGLDPVELKDPRLEIGGPVSPSDEK